MLMPYNIIISQAGKKSWIINYDIGLIIIKDILKKLYDMIIVRDIISLI